MPGAIVAGCGAIVMPLFIVAKTLPGLLVSRASLVKNTPVSPWTWAIEPVGNAAHRAADAAVDAEAGVARLEGVAVEVGDAHADQLGVRRQVLGQVALQAAVDLVGHRRELELEQDDVADRDADVRAGGA